MSRISVFIRFILGLTLASAPFALIGFLAGWLPGAAIGGALGLVIALAVASNAHRIIARFHHARAVETAGLGRSLESAAEDTGTSVPETFLFADPAPNLLVARSFGRAPVLFVSEGLISQLNEPELRAVFRRCLARCSQDDLQLQTFSSVWAALYFSLGPRLGHLSGWNPWRAFCFLCLLPWVRAFLTLGGRKKILPAAETLKDPNEAQGVRKIRASTTTWGLMRGSPGFLPLYFHSPWQSGDWVSRSFS
jgi:hypothetical protein